MTRSEAQPTSRKLRSTKRSFSNCLPNFVKRRSRSRTDGHDGVGTSSTHDGPAGHPNPFLVPKDFLIHTVVTRAHVSDKVTLNFQILDGIADMDTLNALRGDALDNPDTEEGSPNIVFFVSFNPSREVPGDDLKSKLPSYYMTADELISANKAIVIRNRMRSLGKTQTWLVCSDAVGNEYIYFILFALLMQTAKYDIARCVRELILLEKERLSTYSQFKGRDLSKPIRELLASSDLGKTDLEMPARLTALVKAEEVLIDRPRTRLEAYNIRERYSMGGSRLRETNEKALWRNIVDCVEADKDSWGVDVQSKWARKFSAPTEASSSQAKPSS